MDGDGLNYLGADLIGFNPMDLAKGAAGALQGMGGLFGGGGGGGGGLFGGGNQAAAQAAAEAERRRQEDEKRRAEESAKLRNTVILSAVGLGVLGLGTFVVLRKRG